MRIAMVSEHASPLAALGGADAGGQNVHVAELARALHRRGHEVVVHTRQDAQDLPPVVATDQGVTVCHLRAGPAAPVPKDELPPYLPELGARLADRLAADPPDVVHAHFWMSGQIALDATTATGTPVVQTFHALGTVKQRHQREADTSPEHRIPTECEVARNADRVIASSTDERHELLQMGADPRRVDIVPSGVDLATFTPDGPQSARPAGPHLVSVSRLVPRKGVDDAISVLNLLPDAHLTVAGGPDSGRFDDDPEVRRLRALAAELGVADRVRFAGSVSHDEVAALLRSADAVLCLPWYEPFGIVPLEAMACGVPVVATAVGGLLDTVADGRTGLHVPPREPSAAAAAVRTLLDRPRLARRYGRAGVARAAGYGWDSIAERVERTYLAATRRDARAVAAREGTR